MAVLSKGTTFANGDQVTAAKLNNLVDASTFVSGAVDNISTQLSGGGIIVKDGGVSTAKLADSAVTTIKITDSNVTTAKIADANVTFAKLTDVIDDDTMATASATTLATSESIKAYVDSATNFTPSTYAGEESVTLPNGLIMKWGKLNPSTGNNTVTYGTAFPTATVNVQYARFKATHSIYEDNNAVTSESASGFDIYVTNGSAYGTLAWQAIGY